MSVRAYITCMWGSGLGSPVKYGFRMDSWVDVTQNGDEADFVWRGNIMLFNNPNGLSRPSPASDFAAWCVGDDNWQRPPGPEWRDFAFKKPLPYNGNLFPTDKVLLEFRGDTYRAGGGNFASVYTRDLGYVVDTWHGQSAGTQWWQNYTNTDIDTNTGGLRVDFAVPFHLHLTRDPEQVVVFYNTSGMSGTVNYGWIMSVPYIYVRNFIESGDIMFDYRPGDRKINGVWESHNRKNGGVASRKVSGNWSDNLRTEDGDKDATGNPPTKKRNGTWYNMHLIGAHQKD